MNALQAQFIAESRELLEGIGEAMLTLEKQGSDADSLNNLFRLVHTLKGNCGLFEELRPIGSVLHCAEDTLDALRDSGEEISSDSADVLLDAMDFVSHSLDSWESGSYDPEAISPRAKQLVASIKAIREGEAAAPPDQAIEQFVNTPTSTAQTHITGWIEPHLSKVPAQQRDLVWVHYTPDSDCFFKGEDPLQYARSVPSLEYLSIDTIADWPAAQDLDPYNCNLTLTLASSAPEDDVLQVFAYVKDQIKHEVLSGSLCTGSDSAPTATAAATVAASLTPEGMLPITEASRAQALRIWEVQAKIMTLNAATPTWLGRARAAVMAVEQLSESLNRSAWGEAAREALASAETHNDPTPLVNWLQKIPGELVGSGTTTEGASATAHISPNVGAGKIADAPAATSSVPTASTPATSTSSAPAAKSSDAGAGEPAAKADAQAKGDAHPEGEAKQVQILKVPREKIDRLMELIGEMVVAKNSLPYLAEKAETQYGVREVAKELKSQYAVINRIAEEMQDAIMQVRMMPVSSIFQRFPRLVRDLAKKLGKQIKLEITGDETEADKNIIEALADPLIHLVRNSLDHGIEPPEDRQAAGKSLEGTIHISAHQEGDRVHIIIEDDGAGIDVSRVKRKAVEKGLISEEKAAGMSDQEAQQLIFLPGFSTAAVISDVSGRGVGMDVVRSAIAKVNGVIHLSSVMGKGTKVDLSLPLTMAVTNVMMIKSAEQSFAVPMDIVVETVRVPADAIHVVQDHKMTVLRGKIIPLRSLNDMLHLGTGQNPNEENEYAVLVVKVNGESVGIMVDDFHSTIDIILRPLEGMLQNIPAYSGTALLGDGSVLLVLNMKELI